MLRWSQLEFTLISPWSHPDLSLISPYGFNSDSVHGLIFTLSRNFSIRIQAYFIQNPQSNLDFSSVSSEPRFDEFPDLNKSSTITSIWLVYEIQIGWAGFVISLVIEKILKRFKIRLFPKKSDNENILKSPIILKSFLKSKISIGSNISTRQVFQSFLENPDFWFWSTLW